mmetsp:Transcript_48667/g.112781  ORF Transcript_48667/g.112781 Transcript_48667/m.112781 type:complete len:393 (+) Transcript_48667:82-1260(+)
MPLLLLLLLPQLLVGGLGLEVSAVPSIDDMMLVQQLLVTTDARSGLPPAGTEHQEDVNATFEAAGVGLVTPGFMTWEGTHVDESPVAPWPRRPMPECDISPLTGACLPSFMLIGVQKSATSTMHKILSAHPQIRPARSKELLFFNGDIEHIRCQPSEKDLAWYLGKFPRLARGSGLLTGEFSATYLHCWCCAATLKRLMPKLRLMALLRDPIERARSRWREQHAFFGSREHGGRAPGGSFEDYIERELPGLEACMRDAVGLENQAHCAGRQNILGLSVYDTVLQVWFQHFEPQDLLIIYNEQLAVDPPAVMSAVHSHLGIQEHQYPDKLVQSHYNVEGRYGWGRLTLTNARKMRVLERLYAFYRPHMQQLKRMADLGQISQLPRSWVARWSL